VQMREMVLSYMCVQHTDLVRAVGKESYINRWGVANLSSVDK
jgi:hypothetical protein